MARPTRSLCPLRVDCLEERSLLSGTPFHHFINLGGSHGHVEVSVRNDGNRIEFHQSDSGKHDGNDKHDKHDKHDDKHEGRGNGHHNDDDDDQGNGKPDKPSGETPRPDPVPSRPDPKPDPVPRPEPVEPPDHGPRGIGRSSRDRQDVERDRAEEPGPARGDRVTRVVLPEEAEDEAAVSSADDEVAEGTVRSGVEGRQTGNRAQVEADLAGEGRTDSGTAVAAQTPATDRGDAPARVLVTLGREGDGDEAEQGVLAPALADLLAAGVPFDALALGDRLDAFLQRLDESGTEGSVDGAWNLPAWVLAAALAVTACEIARRHYRHAAALAAPAGAADTLSWSLHLSDSDRLARA